MKPIKLNLFNFNRIKKTIARFPLTSLSAFIGNIFMILTFSKNFKENYAIFGTIAYVAIFAIFLFAFIKLFNEALKNYYDLKNLKNNYLIMALSYIVSLPILYGIWELVRTEKNDFLTSYDSVFIYFALIFALVVGCSFIGKFNYHKDFVAYVSKIFQSLIVSNIYSFIVFIGLSGIVFAFTSLFNVNFGEYIYLKIAIFSFILFNVITFLSEFPKVRDSFIDYKYPIAFRFLLVFILAPIIVIYTIILIAYFLKIIALQQMPNNIIVNLVLWYSIISVFYLFFISRIDRYEVINKLRRILPIVIIPLIFMMFLALFIRVREYGFTENRYLSLAAGIWVLLSMIYYIFYKDNSNIVIPIILFVITILTCVGPASAINISVKSQNSRFVNLLKSNEMIEGDKIKSKPDIDSESKKQIVEIVNYMSFKDREDKLNYLPKDFDNNEENFIRIFGFSNLYNDNDYLGYHINDNADRLKNFFIDIKGYNELIPVDIYKKETNIGKFKFIKNENMLEVYRKINDDYELQFNVDLLKLRDKLKMLNKNKSEIVPEDLAIIQDGYKIIFIDLFFPDKSEGDNGDVENINLQFYLLVE